MLAVVLVGGFGTRLRPLTADLPKQMLPSCGVPMIEWVGGHLATHGVEEVGLSLGYRPDDFLHAYPDGRIAGIPYRVAVEPEPRGTAGAVRFAQAEKGRRLEELEEMRAQLTSSEYRGELGSITHALLVREINIKFEDGPEFEAVKFEQ